jgi:type I restriction enzyme M protein
MARRNRNPNGNQVLLFDTRTPKEAFRDLRNYLAGQWVGATRDEALLDELLKCLFCKLYLETTPNGSQQELPEDDPILAAQYYRSVFTQIRSDFPEIYSASTEILLDPPTLVRVMRSLNFSLLDATRDPIGDAYEVFAGSESRARSGQFFTPRNAVDTLVKAVDPQPGERIVDPACGAGGFLASVVQHFRRSGLSQEQVAAAAENLFGVEKDQYLANLARLHVSLLTRGHVRVVCGDSLALTPDNGTSLEPSLPAGGFDVLLTNPPFGVNIVAASPDVLRRFSLARRWYYDKDSQQWQPTAEVRKQVPPQVLFVERCLSLVRDGGRLGMVIPESVLSNKSYRYVVEFLRQRAVIEAVIGMPEDLFKTSGKGGTHTKTCLLILTKSAPKRNGRIFMAEAQWCGHDSRAREIPYDDLPTIAERYAMFRKRKAFEPSALGFILDGKRIDGNVLCPRYYDPDLDAQLQKLSATHELLRFGDLVTEGVLVIETGDEVGKLAYGSGEIPFVRTSDLSNWEIKADPKHCVDRDLYLRLKTKQDVRPLDILMVKDGTYLIGTCAIVTEYDREIVYQSHIYKIRVKDNKYGINPHLLLAVLSSSIVQQQVRAKQFTQDIIDSLGDRIEELLLPIPRSSAKRDYITNLVKKVIEDRIEARELYKKARQEVLEGG